MATGSRSGTFDCYLGGSAITNTDAEVPTDAAEAVVRTGFWARRVSPRLERARTNADAGVESTLQQALREFEPEAKLRAGIAAELGALRTPREVVDDFSDDVLAVSLVVAAFLLAPVIAWLWWAPSLGVWGDLAALVLGFAGAALVLFVTLALIVDLRDALFVLVGIAVSVVALVVAIVVTTLIDLPRNVFTFALVDACLAFPLAFVAAFATAVGLDALQYAIRRRQIVSHPAGIAIEHLLEVAVMARPPATTDLATPGDVVSQKQDLIRNIESAALAIEHLPRQLNPSDSRTTTRLRRRADQVAEAIRALSLEALAGGSTNPRLSSSALTAGLAIARGDWQSLPWAEPVDAEIRPRLRLLAQTAVRAIAPLAIVIVLKTLGVLGADSPANYLLVASVAWLFVTFLIQYDPLFEAKLGALGKIPGLPGRKNG